MIKYTYNDITINNDLRIIFLCGVKFKKNDKRIVLKQYLEGNPVNKALILEEYFDITSRRNGILAYNDIQLNSLFEVENLTAFLADAIFIIHESLSTAAELGVFASNKDLYRKICLITSDEINIEENKLGGFIGLAFCRYPLNIPNIEFYPSVQINHISKNISNYHTSFCDNKIGEYLGKNIDEFIEKTVEDKVKLTYIKSKYKKPIIDRNSYYIYKKKNKTAIQYFINYKTLKYYIVALFSIDKFKGEIKRATSINESVHITTRWYKKVLSETIKEKEGIMSDDCRNSFKILGGPIDNINVDTGIAYILYVLHSAKLIGLPIDSNSFVISHELTKLSNTSFKKVINIEKYKNI